MATGTESASRPTQQLSLVGTDGTTRPVTIADFAWPEHKVAVFCDGWQHHHYPERQASDKAKRDQLADAGWTVLSFWGGEIVRDAEGCATAIIQQLRRT
ncbi:DUF559 domain-containing protein [Natronosporangium hydrolyticum]|uniref:DUF559 domain-containing protein n=1 Tax=Natronosporangium hydrolyticum TaxID=2811111 RepID=A0A895YGT1_9ACTN|nr:DUF559 domain-containing protein [Natronosporangium hydrolyticum]QSB14603.1 DUF559 domain-containing protein [Natronosporangium hydrolyticum]